MEKRLIIAIGLSLLIMLSWSRLISKIYHIDNTRVTEKTIQPAKAVSPVKLIPAPEPESPPEALFKLTRDNFDLTFIEPQAAIQGVVFNAYQRHQFPLKYGFWLGEKEIIFRKTSSNSEPLTFVYRGQDRQIIKRFFVHNSNYTIELELEIENLSSAPLEVNSPLVLGVLNFSGDANEARLKDVTVSGKDKVTHLNPRKDATFEEVKFLALRDRYFCAIIEPASHHYSGFIRKLNPQESEVSLRPKDLTVAPGQKIQETFRIYLGPQQLSIINNIQPEWSAVMYYGTFDFISHLLLQGLEMLYRLVHNWGLAIIILSLLIYLILFPLSLKQMHSMKQMQSLQPRIEELRKIYKDNPQKLNKEIMELYRTYKINPFSGCLPLVLQIPVFFALYQALIRSVLLKGARFLWIKDLSEPDRLFIIPGLGTSFPIIGNEINILPILMTVGMFIQQKISMKTASGSSAEQQKIMLVVFPLMFGLIFYRMPSGLVLYWFINSSLMLWSQLRMSRTK